MSHRGSQWAQRSAPYHLAWSVQARWAETRKEEKYRVQETDLGLNLASATYNLSAQIQTKLFEPQFIHL